MRSLTIHVGTHKTGSTAIQQSLVCGRDRLAELGVLYPRSGVFELSGGHLNLAWEVVRDHRFRRDRGSTADLIEEVSRVNPDHVVISAETLSSRPGTTVFTEWAYTLGRHISANRVDIVGVVRPQWEYIESVYCEQVKRGFISASFKEFIDANIPKGRFDYGKVFDPWNEVFPRFVTILPYTSNIVETFWSHVGVGEPVSIPRVNSRPGALEMCLLKSASVWFDDPAQRELVATYVRDWFAARGVGDEPFRGLTPTIVERICRRWGPTNRSFSGRYLGDRHHSVFRPPERLPSASRPVVEPRLIHEMMKSIRGEFMPEGSR